MLSQITWRVAPSTRQAAWEKASSHVVPCEVGPCPEGMELRCAQHRRVPRAELAARAQEFQRCALAAALFAAEVNSGQFSCTIHVFIMHVLTMSSVIVAHWYLQYHSSNYGCTICSNNRSGVSCSCILPELMHLH